MLVIPYASPVNLTYLNNRKPGVAHTAPMVALTPTRATLVTSKSSSRQLKKRWSEAKIRRLQRLLLLASTGDRLRGGVSRPDGLDFSGFVCAQALMMTVLVNFYVRICY